MPSLPGTEACRWLAGGSVISAICLSVAAAAQAQEAAPPSLYICLSNSCVTPDAAGARKPEPAAASRARAQTMQMMQNSSANSMLNSLTDEERASAKVSQSVDGNRMNMSVEYQKADGTVGRRYISVELAPVSDPS